MAISSNLWSDLRFGARAVFRRRTFAAVVMLTLALGIGINVALFTLIENALLRTLPVPEPERLVNLTDPGPKDVGQVGGIPTGSRPSESGGMETVFSYPMFRDLEREQEPFVGLAAHRVIYPILSTGEGARSAMGTLVSGSYFSVLGLQPALGRLLGPQDDEVDGVAESVVLSYPYWQSDFGGDPDVLGQTLRVDGVPLTIVGVAPEGFRGTVLSSSILPVSIFVPISIRFSDNALVLPNHDMRHHYWAHLFGRLKPGVTLETAAAAMNPLFRGILSQVDAPQLLEVSDEEREAFRLRPLVLEPGARGQTGSEVLSPVRIGFTLLLALSSVVLLLCCANAAGLILLRATTRSGEMAVRASMGATRVRLASLLFTESLVLALPAALIGLAIALLMLRGSRLLAGLPEPIPSILEAVSGVDLSTAAVLMAIGVAVLSAVIVGLVPLRRLIRTEPGKALQSFGARHTTAKGVARFRAGLSTVQVALSMALLAMTGAFVLSLSNIARLDLGLDLESVAMVSVEVPTGQSADRAGRARIEQGLSAIPGVSSVASSRFPILSSQGLPAFPATVDGVDGEQQLIAAHSISPDFFRTFGIQLLAGREFNEADSGETDSERPVVIVSQAFVERFGLTPDAILGRTIDYWFGGGEIVGVMSDVRVGKVTRETELPIFQPRSSQTSSTYYVRSALPTDELLRIIRETVV
jgi:predicted permease